MLFKYARKNIVLAARVIGKPAGSDRIKTIS